jgi:choline dehydrogenase-like flavoprotein
MHTDARQLENGSLIEGDLCIIGAGAAGISIALEWNNTPFKVILLEGGGFDYDPKMQASFNGKYIGQKYFQLNSTRLHQFGGTTALWGGFCSTFDEIDFKKREWVEHSGWPFEKKELDPYYLRAERILELPDYSFDLDENLKRNPEIYSIPFDTQKVWNKLWKFSPPTRFGQVYRKDIVNSKNIHLYTYAKATNIITNEGLNKIEKVIVKNYSNKSHVVKAKKFVLACGAIQNARMLLASNSQQPSGLGNQNDNVGRYFMEHLEMLNSAELWFQEKIDVDLYLFSRSRIRAELAISENAQMKHKILNGTAGFRRLAPSRFSDRSKEWGIDANGKPREKTILEKIKNRILIFNEKRIKNIDNAYLLATRIEQSPNPDSRVTISDELDLFGVPLVELNWQLSVIDKRSIQQMYHIIGTEFGALGLARVKLMDWLTESSFDKWPDSTTGGWHHMGTTKMSENPVYGVVDSNCKVHGISNLYIAGSSCFPTAGSVNPTLTLVALCIRLSDHLKHLN